MQRSVEDQIRSLADRNVSASYQSTADSNLALYTSIDPRHRRRGSLVVAAVVLVVVVLVGVTAIVVRPWTDDGNSGYVSTGPETTLGPDFCSLMAAGADVPESYIGTSEHRAAIASMLAVAPPDLRTQLQVLLDYLESGAVDPNQPDTNLIENWPPAVQSATGDLRQYARDVCGIDTPG